ncbi:MAG: phage portal protein [Synergistaceae bacterium]|nr:phage portal protein [Synergistaceae bacterium]MBQ3693770.1 phage portal protein [Synergistaceae bacterium]MBQ9628360.1 phage portal protein [Synergistaceae bacterium]MBR0251696.1 phage portal protein [Synergistaceae bacterium]
MSRKMRVNASGYSQHGASRSRPALLKWYASSKSPHEDISQNIKILRERSRDLYAGGGPLGRGAIDRLVLNAIGSGLKLNVRIDPERLGMSESKAREWASQTESEFSYWAENKDCDISRMLNFYELQSLAMKSVLLDGECLVLLPMRKIEPNAYSLCIQLIESERLESPTEKYLDRMIDEGVELDVSGEPVAYWIANRNPNAEILHQPLLEHKRIRVFGYNSGRRNIIHLMNPERINQHRGVPFLAPVIEVLRQLGRYTDAELMAAVVSGMYAIFFEHEPRDEMNIGEEDFAVEEGLGETTGLEGISQEQLYSAIMDLPEGVKPVSVSPNRPNVSFDAFIQSLVRQIGSALGLPAELILMQFTSSYSASRGALLEAWKLFKYWRSWFAMNFCQVIYEEWLSEAVLLGRIKAPGYFDDDVLRKAYAWAEWTGPSQGQLDPVKEVNAAALRVQNGFSTRQKETAELTGEDYDLNVRQLQREESLRNGSKG